MSLSKASALIKLAASAGADQLYRHLLVAAAINEALSLRGVVVGGTAEEFWTAAAYHETDLDVCVSIDAQAKKVLARLGFEHLRGSRHWYHEQTKVAVEFPSTKFDGDPDRLYEESVGNGRAIIIGVDDLYVDRLRQATVSSKTTSMEFHSTLAVASAQYENIDWPYVSDRISQISEENPLVGREMKRLNSLIRRRARKALSGP